MVLIRGLHLTALENLPSILAKGLEPRVPSEHNYRHVRNPAIRGRMSRQPQGVYISFIDDQRSFYRPGDGLGNAHYFYDKLLWQDVENVHILVHYCGPMIKDPLMRGCAAFVDLVPPSALFLCYGDPQVGYPDQLKLDA